MHMTEEEGGQGSKDKLREGEGGGEKKEEEE